MTRISLSFIARHGWLAAFGVLGLLVAAEQCRSRSDRPPTFKIEASQPLIPDLAQWRALTQADMLLAPDRTPDGFVRIGHGALDPRQISPMGSLPGLSLPPFEQRFKRQGDGNDEDVLLRFATWPSAEQAEEHRALAIPGNRATIWVAGRCVVSIAPPDFEGTLGPDTIRRFRDALGRLGAAERAKLSAGLVNPRVKPARWEVIEERSFTRAEWQNSPFAARLSVETVLKHQARLVGAPPAVESAAQVLLTYYQLPAEATPSDREAWRAVFYETLKAGSLVAVLEEGTLFIEISAGTGAFLERVVELQQAEIPGALRLSAP